MMVRIVERQGGRRCAVGNPKWSGGPASTFCGQPIPRSGKVWPRLSPHTQVTCQRCWRAVARLEVKEG